MKKPPSVYFSTAEKPPATDPNQNAKGDGKVSKDLTKEDPNKLLILQDMKAAYETLSQRVLALYQDKRMNLENNIDKEWYNARVSFWMKRYENFVGLTDVKEAQVRVVRTEKQFIDSQENRRETQKAINEIQQTLKSLYDELERTHRGQNKYLELVTKEHHVLQEQTALTDKLNVHEREEREAFSKLSRAVRDSHESERAQAEKTKYWSVIGSIIGTCLGILGTTINNRLRMRELRQLVKDAAAINSQAAATAAASAAVLTHAPAPPQNPASQQEPASSYQPFAETLEKITNDIAQAEKSSSESIGEIKKTLSQIETSLSSIEKQEASNVSKGISISPAIFQHQQDELKKILIVQQEKLEKLVKDMKFQLDSKDLRDIQAQVKLIAIKESDSAKVSSRALDTLNRNASTALASFEKRVLDVEEMVKDVRSLLLAQTMAIKTSAAQNKEFQARAAAIATAHAVAQPAAAQKSPDINESAREAFEAVERSHLTIIGTVETALRDHEERLNSAMILNSVFVALLTPVIAYAVSKCL